MTTLPVFNNGGYHAKVIEPPTLLMDSNVSSSLSNHSSSNHSLLQQHHDDENHLPESSIEMAILAGKKRFERLNNTVMDPKFPTVNVENINKLREEAKSSNEPELLFFFARYLLLDCLKKLKPNPDDPNRMTQLKDNFITEAIAIIKRLSTHRVGHSDAQFFLGNCYGNGLYGLKVDLDKAFSLYMQGSKLNHPECSYRVAVCYELGLGTKKDYKFAMQFYRKAANLSNPFAMYKLGLILLNGLLNQSKNPPEAISWFLRGIQVANEDYPQPLHELGLCYERNDIPSVIPDPNYAYQLFAQAAQLGYAPSQFKLGLAYEHGLLNCPVDPRRSIAWYSRAAEQSMPEAELALSGWYLTGFNGVLIQNPTEAYLWAKKAAVQGLPKAEFTIAYYTETGVGVHRDLVEAKRWYQKAAQHGDQKAIQRLASFHQSTPLKNSKDSDCNIM